MNEKVLKIVLFFKRKEKFKVYSKEYLSVNIVRVTPSALVFADLLP